MAAPYTTPTYVLRVRGLDTSLMRARVKLTQGAASVKLNVSDTGDLSISLE